MKRYETLDVEVLVFEENVMAENGELEEYEMGFSFIEDGGDF